MNAVLKEPLEPAPVCPRCDNRRVIESRFLKRRIRCTLCTRRRPDRTGRHLRALSESSKRELSAKEVRRIITEIDRMVVNAVIERVKIPGIPDHLASTDRILQRWAAAPTGMPSDDPDVYRVSRPPPLDDKTQEAVSDIVKAAPFGVRSLVYGWYDPRRDTRELAAKRRMSRRQLGRERDQALVYVRARFLESKHPDLPALVRQLT